MTKLRIAVVGVGAIGGWVAARLALAGHAVSLLARGETLSAIRARGLEIAQDGKVETVCLPASDKPSDLGPQDLVIVAVKSPALAAAADSIAALCDRDASIVTMMNGVPWWFFADRPGDAPAIALASVDPAGHIARTIALERVVGTAVHAVCSTEGPGRVVHRTGKTLIFGEPKGGGSARLRRICELFRDAGLEAVASERIQRDVWYKLWGNMTMNPISALTGALSDAILADPLVRQLMLQAMAEAAEIGRRIGCPIAETGEARLEIARKLGPFRTSMLQDADAGRPMEIDALLEAPREIAMQVGVETPAIDTLLGLTRVFARARGPVERLTIDETDPASTR